MSMLEPLPHEGGVRPYGWRPQKPDFRDHPLKLDRKTANVLPPSVDLRGSGFLPPIFDQLQLGSCTANAWSAAMAFALNKEGYEACIPSRLFIYFYERQIEDTINQDSGAELRDGAKALSKYGACDEQLMPYVISKFKRAPTQGQDGDASTRLAKSYQAIPGNLVDLKTCLAQGFPFVFGFSVYESFESDAVAKSGKLPMPKKTESMIGGHAVCAVGYSKTAILCRNSWGPDWGIQGHFWMPNHYITNPDLASDFWTLRVVGK